MPCEISISLSRGPDWDSNPGSADLESAVLNRSTTGPQIAGVGFEPTTLTLWGLLATILLHPAKYAEFLVSYQLY